MNALVGPDVTADLFRSGVDAVCAAAASRTGGRWDEPCCGSWTATDLARHLLGVVGWYHAWLDRAMQGSYDRPFPSSELDERAARTITEHDTLDGPGAIREFVAESSRYLDRSLSAWDMPYGFPLGTVTAGRHVGTAACEWHLHAWDLTLGMAHRHHPADATSLYLATGDAILHARRAPGMPLMRTALRFTSRHRPWATILRKSGRVPA